MEAQAVLSLGHCGSPPLWSNEDHILFACGNGLVSQNVSTGAQTHFWGTGNKQLGASAGVPVFHVSPASQLLAMAQNGQQPSIFLLSTHDFDTKAIIRDVKDVQWHALSLSAEGSRLASVSAYPDHVLDVWDVQAVRNAFKADAATPQTSLARYPLGPRLAGHKPAFFPLNPAILAVAGASAVRVLYVESILGANRLHQADVDLTVMREDETLTSLAWAPTGTLLLGTSLGRLLAVPHAAPCVVKEHTWGTGSGSLTATPMYTPAISTFKPHVQSEASGGLAQDSSRALPQPDGHVIAICILPAYLLLVYSGQQAEGQMVSGDDAQSAHHAQMMWLAHDSLTPTALCDLPGSCAEAASISPDMTSVLVSLKGGQLLQANAMFTLDHPDDLYLDSADQDLGFPVVQSKVLASFHTGRTGGAILLPNQMFATGGVDHHVRLWLCQKPSSEGGAKPADPPANQQQPRFSLITQPVATWNLGAPVTCLSNFLDRQMIVAGTSTGEVYMLSAFKVHSLISSGGLIKLPAPYGAPRPSSPGTPSAVVDDAMSPLWAQRPFDKPVTSIAFSADGHMCAMCSADQGMVVFYRVVSISNASTEVTLHLMGFYPVVCPQHLAFSPHTFGTEYKPLLVVSTTNGELQVLKPPEGMSHLRQPSACVPAGNLLVALLRASSIVTAMVTAPINAVKSDEVGTFWLFVCCLDKSVRRMRLPTDQQKATATAAVTAFHAAEQAYHQAAAKNHKLVTPSPPVISAPQNFQISEIERPQELGTPACHASLSGTGKHMVVSTQCGSTVVFALPEITSVVRWPMHAHIPTHDTWIGAPQAVYSGADPSQLVPAPPASVGLLQAKGGAAAMDDKMLISTGVDGSIHVVELQCDEPGNKHVARSVSHFRRANAFLASSAREAAPPGLGTVIASAGAAPAPPDYLEVLAARPKAVLTWKQAQAAVQAHAAAIEVKAAGEKLAAKRDHWLQQLSELKERNNAAEGVEKLPDDEFVMDRGLQQQLRQEAQHAIAAAKSEAIHGCTEPQVVHGRLVGAVLNSFEPGGSQQILVPLPEHNFISAVSAEDMKRWKSGSSAGCAQLKAGVTSYPIRALTRDEDKALRKVKFLRQVEQAEFAERSRETRGQVITIKRWQGQMAARIDLLGLEAENSDASGDQAGDKQPGTLSTAPSVAAFDDEPQKNGQADDDEDDGLLRQRVDDDNIEGNEVENGLCGLLYAPLQLHCPTRRTAQSILLMEEIRAAQRLFNARLVKLQGRKAGHVSQLEERAARIAEIQKDLAAAGPAAVDFSGTDLEQWQDWLVVRDDEVKVERYVSEEEAARRAAAAQLEEEARRRAEADDLRQRALREMMNSTLDIKKASSDQDGLKREPWMDLPRTQLSADQRKQLAEWEKRAAEMEEEQIKARRALESERKGLEFEMADIVLEFNNQLRGLATAKIKVDVELRSLELQALDCALALESAHASHEAQTQLSAARDQAAATKEWKASLLQLAHHIMHHASKDYETLAAQERALDKAIKREMGTKDEDMWETVQSFYKDRTHGVRPGNQGKPLSDLMAKLPEAAAIAAHAPPTSGDVSSERQHLLPSTAVLPSTPAEPPCSIPVLSWMLKHGRRDGQASIPGDRSHAHGLTSNIEYALEQLHLSSTAKEKHMWGVPSHGHHKDIASAADGPARVHLLALTQHVGHRSLGHILDMVAQGRPLRSLIQHNHSSDSRVLPLVPQDAEQSDPFQSALAHTAFGTPHIQAAEPSVAPPSPSSPLTSRSPSRQAGSRLTGDGGSSFSVGTPGGRAAAPQLPTFSLADKPAAMEEVWWQRLMDLRDARITLEQAADASLSRLAWASLACDELTYEAESSSEDLDAVATVLSNLSRMQSRALVDLMLHYRLSNGQVEVPCPGDAPLTAMAPATLLQRWQVERANIAIQESGGEKLGLLQDLKALATARHLSRWEVARAELRQTHARSELTDIQLLHVTKELQGVLRDRSTLSRMDTGSQMEARTAAAAASHAARLALRQDALGRLTHRIAYGLREHEDLEGATHVAHAAADEAKRVRAVIQRSAADEEAAHKRSLRSIVGNSQLKDIAAAQAQEMQALLAELDKLKTRTFPMLTPSSVTSSIPSTLLLPDLRIPRTPGSLSQGLAAGIFRPSSVPAGKSRPMWETAGGLRAPVRPNSSIAQVSRYSPPPAYTAASAGGSVVVSRVSSAKRSLFTGSPGTAPLPPRPSSVMATRLSDRSAS